MAAAVVMPSVTPAEYFGLDWRFSRKRAHSAAFGEAATTTTAVTPGYPYGLVERLLSVPVMVALGVAHGAGVTVRRWGTCVEDSGGFLCHDWRTVWETPWQVSTALLSASPYAPGPGAALRATLAGLTQRPCSLHVGQARVVHWRPPQTQRPELSRSALSAPPLRVVLSERHAQELVVDLDLSDYDQHRPGLRAALCGCRDKQCCAVCWLLIELSAIVLEAALGPLLGTAPPPLWVFSGRRGAHAWFATPTACTLSHAARSELAATLTAWKGAGRAGPGASPAATSLSASHGHSSGGGGNAAAADVPASVYEARPTALCGVPPEAWAAVAQHWAAVIVEERDLLVRRPALRDYLLVLWATATCELLLVAVERLMRDAATCHSRHIWRYLCEHDAHGAARARLYARLALPLVDVGVLDTRHHLVRVPFSLHEGSRRPSLPLAVGASALRARRFNPCSDTEASAAPAAMAMACSVAEDWLARFGTAVGR